MSDEPTLTIRNAEPADAAAVAHLIGQLGYVTDGPAVSSWIRRLKGAESDRLLVGVRGDTVVAFATVHVTPFPHENMWVARLTAFVVLDTQRGTGTATVLLEACETFAQAAECGRIEVTAGHHREGAHAFYEANGYKPNGRAYFAKEL